MRKIPRQFQRLAGVGLEFAAAFFGGLLLGGWLDRRMGNLPDGFPLAAAVGGLLGAAVGFYNIFRRIRSTQDENRR